MQRKVREIVKQTADELGVPKAHADLMYKAPFKYMETKIRNQPDLTETSKEDDFDYFILKHFGTFRITEKRIESLKSKLF